MSPQAGAGRSASPPCRKPPPARNHRITGRRAALGSPRSPERHIRTHSAGPRVASRRTGPAWTECLRRVNRSPVIRLRARPVPALPRQVPPLWNPPLRHPLQPFDFPKGGDLLDSGTNTCERARIPGGGCCGPRTLARPPRTGYGATDRDASDASASRPLRLAGPLRGTGRPCSEPNDRGPLTGTRFPLRSRPPPGGSASPARGTASRTRHVPRPGRYAVGRPRT